MVLGGSWGHDSPPKASPSELYIHHNSKTTLYIPSTTFISSLYHFTLNSTKTLFCTLIVRLPNQTLLLCVWQKKHPTIYPKKNKENWTNTLWSTAYGGVLRYLGWSSVKASGTLTSVHIYTHTYVRRSVWIYTPRNPQFSYSNFGGTHSITRQERMKPKK